MFMLRHCGFNFVAQTTKGFPNALSFYILKILEMAYHKEQPSSEFHIPIGYGSLAAKAWGHEEGIPVLALHGWQDNLGTFETLAPLLSPALYIVAFDGVGHGLSAHKPTGCFYNYMETLIDIKRVVNFLKWEKFYIIGHSLGGTLAVLYASVYSESVSGVILLDIVKPLSKNTSQLPLLTRTGIESFLQLEEKMKNPVPVYEYSEARQRLLDATFGHLTNESADVLLKRSCKLSDCGKGVVFTRDLRVKVTQDLQRFSHDSLIPYMENVKCNLLIILANSSFLYDQMDSTVMSNFLAIYKKNCKSFTMNIVEGNHYVHLNHPERVAPIINNFFSTHLKL